MDLPVSPISEQVQDYVEPVGPTQVPEGLASTPGLQKTLAYILSVYTSLAQSVMIPVAPTTSQSGGGVQTQTACTPEQLARGHQTQEVLPVQHVAAIQPKIFP